MEVLFNPSAFLILLLPLAIGIILRPSSSRRSATVSGWTLLAQHFGSAHDPPGEIFDFASVRFRKVRYGKVLCVTVSTEGIRFRPKWLIRPHHDTLFVPSHAITLGERKPWTMNDILYLTIDVPNEPLVEVIMAGNRLIDTVQQTVKSS